MDEAIKQIIEKVKSNPQELTSQEQAQLSKLLAILHEFFHGED